VLRVVEAALVSVIVVVIVFVPVRVFVFFAVFH
jgi:hypothetical protein